MFCINCGQDIADGAKFCPKCGAVQEQASRPADSAPQQDYNPYGAPQQTYSAPTSGSPKKTPMGLIIGIIAALVVVIAVVIVLLVVKPGSKDEAPVEEPTQTDVAPEAEPEEPVEEPVAAPAGPSGHYIMTEITEDGETFGTDLIAFFGGESYLDMNDDGSFLLYFYPEETTVEGTWADDTLTVDGGSIAYIYDADAMTVTVDDEEDGMSMVFTHESVAPVIEYIVMDDGAGELTEDDTDDSDYSLYNFVVPETVIYDEGGVTVTLTDVEDDDWYGYDVNFTVVNNSDKNILVTTDIFAINGCVFNESLYTDVAAGKSANDSLSIDYDELERAGLTQFFELALNLKVEDYDSWDDIGTSGLVHIYVDDNAMTNGYEADALPSGELLFDSNGIQLYFMGFENDGWDDGDGYGYFMIVNNSGEDIYAYSDDMSYSGWMVGDSFGADVDNGFWTITTMYIGDYEDANLEGWDDITDVEFTLRLVYQESWDDICDDTIISFTAFNYG